MRRGTDDVAFEETQQRSGVEVEHARVGDLRILHAVDADGGEFESVTRLDVFDLVLPQHHHVITIGNEARIKAARLVRLEAIPGRSKSLAVAQCALEPAIVAAIGKARRFVDRDIFIVAGADALAIAVVHSLEQGPDGTLVGAHLRQYRTHVFRPVKQRVAAAYDAGENTFPDGR